MRHLRTVLLAAVLAMLGAQLLAGDQPLPNPTATQPSYPQKLEWDLKIAPDTLFYTLCTAQRVTDKNAVSWTVPTQGFRDFRVVVFTAGAERTSKVVATQLKVTCSVKNGEKKFDYFKRDVAIDTNSPRTDGEAMLVPVYGQETTLEIEPRNMNTDLFVTVYLLK